MMKIERTIQTLAVLLICLATSMVMTPASFAAPDEDTALFVTVTQIPDFVLISDATLPDPTFRSDVAILAPFLGTQSMPKLFHLPKSNSKSLGDSNFGNQSPLLGAPYLKWYFPKFERDAKLADFRAIVQAPFLCFIMKQQHCDPDMLPTGVLQFTSLDPKAGTTGVIRFPLLPSYFIYFHASDRSMNKLQLWISNSQTEVIKTINLFDYGIGDNNGTIPMLAGVSTADLLKTSFEVQE